jgi:putative DNA primase/helicase
MDTNLRFDPILLDSAAIARAAQPRKHNEQAVLAAASHHRLTIDTERNDHDQWIRGQFDDDAYADFCELCENPSDEVFALARELVRVKPVPAPYDPAALAAEIAADAAVVVTKPVHQIEALCLTTDLANARRIQRHFGKRVLFAGGQWFGWTGKQWKPSTEAIWQCAARLSTLIRDEATMWRAKAEAARAANHPENGMREDDNADKLEKYIPHAESREKMHAAMNVLAQISPADISQFDQDPWALNVNNGIIDLPTGTLRPHDPDAFITKLIPIDYDPNARADRFSRFVYEIMNDVPEMSRFLQRWVGYGATGSTREEKFAIHWGEGGNGKSKLIEIVSAVLGADYCMTAPKGMHTSAGKDRHPTEIADLKGKRLVTDHELAESDVVDESLIKRVTGGDRQKGRHMRQDFFEFIPTHKTQFLTNHKPRIIGTDKAIWRRVLLVPYLVTFGSVAEVSAGTHMRIRDENLIEALKLELPGILAWIVRGAVEWHADGLNPPEKVIQATAEYRSDQDTIGQFAHEQCEVGAGYEVPFNGTAGFSTCMFPRYNQWCADSNVKPLGKRRFLSELMRVTKCTKHETTRKCEVSGRQVAVTMLKGVR